MESLTDRVVHRKNEVPGLEYKVEEFDRSELKQAANGLILNTYSCHLKKGGNGYCEVNNEGGIVDSCWARAKLFILLV